MVKHKKKTWMYWTSYIGPFFRDMRPGGFRSNIVGTRGRLAGFKPATTRAVGGCGTPPRFQERVACREQRPKPAARGAPEPPRQATDRAWSSALITRRRRVLEKKTSLCWTGCLDGRGRLRNASHHDVAVRELAGTKLVAISISSARHRNYPNVSPSFSRYDPVTTNRDGVCCKVVVLHYSIIRIFIIQ
jgi:hypothetical protein